MSALEGLRCMEEGRSPSGPWPDRRSVEDAGCPEGRRSRGAESDPLSMRSAPVLLRRGSADCDLGLCWWQ